MSFRRRVSRAILIFCFFLNTTIFDISYGVPFNNSISENDLSTASVCNDLLGIEHKDIGRIKIALEAQLREFFSTNQEKLINHEGSIVQFSALEDIIEKRIIKEQTIYQPADIQFFYKEAKPVDEGIRLMCRIKDEHGTRTYYAVFSLKQDEEGAFKLKGIYTEQEYENNNRLTKTLPERQEKDEKAINRYIQHEEGIDAIIRWAHESEDITIYSPNELGFDYPAMVRDIIEKAKIGINNNGQIPLEERKCFIVPITEEVEIKLRKVPVLVIAENGEERQITPLYHSSNNAVHIFLSAAVINSLTNNLAFARLEKDRIKDKLSHEIGVMLGCPVLRFSEGAGDPVNEIYERYLSAVGPERTPGLINELLDGTERPVLHPKKYSIQNLDTNLLTRDYAEGDGKEEITERVAKIIGRAQSAVDFGLEEIAQKNKCSVDGDIIPMLQVLLDKKLIGLKNFDQIIGLIEESTTAPWVFGLVARRKMELFRTYLWSSFGDHLSKEIEGLKNAKKDALIAFIEAASIDRYSVQKITELFKAIRKKGLKVNKDWVGSLDGGSYEVVIRSPYEELKQIANAVKNGKIDPKMLDLELLRMIAEGAKGETEAAFRAIVNVGTGKDKISWAAHYEEFVRTISDISPTRVKGRQVVGYIRSIKRRETAAKLAGKKDGRTKPGRSAEDALMLILTDETLHNKSKESGFTIDEYHKAYDGAKELLGFAPLPEKHPDSQTRRDLKQLAEEGYLKVDKSEKSHRYKLAKEVDQHGFERLLFNAWMYDYEFIDYSDPFSEKSQIAFRRTNMLRKIYDEENLSVGQQSHIMLLYSRLFGDRDFEEILQFFKSRKDLPAESFFRNYLLFDAKREFLAIYFIAKMIDPATVEGMKGQNVTLPQYLFKSIHDGGDEFQKGLLGPELMSFINSIYDDLLDIQKRFIEHYISVGQYSLAEGMAKANIAYIRNDLGSLEEGAPQRKTLEERETEFTFLLKSSIPKELPETGREEDKIDAEGEIEALERRINEIWDETGEKVHVATGEEARAAYGQILQAVNAYGLERLADGMIALGSEKTFRRVCVSLLFGKRDHRRVIDLYKRVSNSDRSSRFAESILSSTEHLLIYFIARLMDPESVRRFMESGGKKSFFKFYADSLLNPEFSVNEVSEKSGDAFSGFKRVALDFIMEITALHNNEGKYEKALEILDNCEKVIQCEYDTDPVEATLLYAQGHMKGLQLMKKIITSKKERREEFLRTREFVILGRNLANSKAVKTDEMERNDILKRLDRKVTEYYRLITGKGLSDFDEEVQKVLFEIMEIDDQRIKEGIGISSATHIETICCARIYAGDDYEYVRDLFDELIALPNSMIQLQKKMLTDPQFFSLVLIAQLMDSKTIEELREGDITFVDHIETKIFGAKYGFLLTSGYSMEVMQSPLDHVRDFFAKKPKILADRGKYREALSIIDNFININENELRMQKDETSGNNIENLLWLRKVIMVQRNMDNADQAGKEIIPTHPDTKYTFLMTSEFFANGELEKHKVEYADRFNLDSISAETHGQFVDKVLAKAKDIENRTITLVSNKMPEEQLGRLTKAGVRFLRVDTDSLLNERTGNKQERDSFQLNTYVIMLLTRHINEDTPLDSPIYSLLNFYLRSHFNLDDVSVESYIKAIINNNITLLIKGILSYRPAQPHELPEYDKVAATLIMA